MIHSGTVKGQPCLICQVPGHVCGDDHMRRGPVDNVAPNGGTMAPEPQELKEYQYVVNNTVTTAMLTPKMAKRLNATEVGSDAKSLNGGYTQQQNQAVYSASDMNTGVTGDGATKVVRPQQKGVDKQGRTGSMRRTIDDIPDEEKASYQPQDDDNDNEQAATPATPAAPSPMSTATTKTRRPQDK